MFESGQSTRLDQVRVLGHRQILRNVRVLFVVEAVEPRLDHEILGHRPQERLESGFGGHQHFDVLFFDSLDREHEPDFHFESELLAHALTDDLLGVGDESLDSSVVVDDRRFRVRHDFLHFPPVDIFQRLEQNFGLFIV